MMLIGQKQAHCVEIMVMWPTCFLYE